jgi:DHA2 family multidrug resistance protein-like MFS transporter
VAEAARLPDALRAALLDTARAAFTQAFEMTATICAAVAVTTAVVALVLLRKVPTGESPARDVPLEPEGAA